MNVTTRELVEARDITAELLERLNLPAYLFEVEAREGPWKIRIDCGDQGEWQSITIPVEIDILLASRSNAALRARLLEEWRDRLPASRDTKIRPASA